MKKYLIVLLLLFVLNTFLSAQSNIEDALRIIGTWVGIDIDGDITRIVFNSDGTVSGGWDGVYDNGRYFLNNSILFIRTNETVYVIPYYFSPDGRILVLNGGEFFPYWLERQEPLLF
ncbi:MAG: hypothetical protein FWC97_09175 [Treponema sp.]|nr:hypothetical protein [Treponema sp.]